MSFIAKKIKNLFPSSLLKDIDMKMVRLLACLCVAALATPSAAKFSAKGASDWAKAHWNDCSFDGLGGACGCTPFVSQALIRGGGWKHKPLNFCKDFNSYGTCGGGSARRTRATHARAARRGGSDAAPRSQRRRTSTGTLLARRPRQ